MKNHLNLLALFQLALISATCDPFHLVAGGVAHAKVCDAGVPAVVVIALPPDVADSVNVDTPFVAMM